MQGKNHNPAPSSATQTVELVTSKARPIRGPTPLIPDYRLINEIGHGTFGTVWLAEESLAGVFRAIKVLDPPKASDGTPRIDRELSGIHAYQANAKDHPHLVRILKTGQCALENPRDDQSTGSQSTAAPAGQPPTHQRRTVYYVMEIADHVGGAQPHHMADYEPLTLAALLRQKHRLPITHAASPSLPPMRGRLLFRLTARPPSAPRPSLTTDPATAHLPNGCVIDYALSLLDAIEHLHKAGLHHRDVKPSNCLFIGGILKLADVGLTTSHNHEHVGTLAYMPPPQSINSRPAKPTDSDPAVTGSKGFDPASPRPTDSDPWAAPDDLYALGKVIYQMTTGLPAADYPDWPADLDPAGDPRLPDIRKLINDLCHSSPARRVTDIRDARRRLTALTVDSNRRNVTRRTLLATLLVGSLSCILLGGWGMRWWYERSNPLRRTRGTAPFDGSKLGQILVQDGTEFRLLRLHKPDEPVGLPHSQTRVRFHDLQTGMRIDPGTGGAMVLHLVVAGALEIFNLEKKDGGNPGTGDIRIADGEIDQVYLIAGEKGDKNAIMVLLYHGEPGAEPGVRGRFRRKIRLSEFQANFPSATETPIFLARCMHPTPRTAERKYHEKDKSSNFEVVKIAEISWRRVTADTSDSADPNLHH